MDGRQASIRIRIGAGVLLAAIVAGGCGGAAHTATSLIVLGVDGMDPGFLERHWSSLPNLDRLRREGEFKRLGTTVPPQSPVAWSTFITGMDPGGHGIFDFVHRDPATMAPVSALGETVESKHKLRIGPYALPLTAGEVRSFRQGKAFWQFLSEHGVPATILRMPVNFPPVRCRCNELSGMGTPDLAGTYGTFTFFTDDPSVSAGEAPGGRIVRVALSGDDAVLPLEGPANSLRQDHARTQVAIAAHVDRAVDAARFDLPAQSVILKQGEWSGWLRVSFPMLPGIGADGIIRIYAQELAPRLRIYVSPVNLDPARPGLPISHPAGYSRELAADIGPFYTQGIAEDTAALRRGVFDLREYLAQSRRVTEEQLALLHYGIEHFQGGLFFQHLLGIDQNSHMLWGRHEPELLETYQRIDRAVGWVREHAPTARLIVMSDHGFTSFDRAFNLNAWLYREGFLTLDDPSNTGPDELFAHVDWSKTQAYGLGLNGLYLNLRGRERQGIVEPGETADRLLRVIARRLLEFRDPEGAGQPVSDVYQPRQIFHGGALAAAPDLIVGYSPGYRCGWGSALGAVATQTVEENRDAWIGDHCIAARHVPGVLISNRPIRLANPGLADVTLEILREFGLEAAWQNRSK